MPSEAKCCAYGSASPHLKYNLAYYYEQMFEHSCVHHDALLRGLLHCGRHSVSITMLCSGVCCAVGGKAHPASTHVATHMWPQAHTWPHIHEHMATHT
eukprot:1153437-Pelagomonas_calceolata.AAC.6